MVEQVAFGLHLLLLLTLVGDAGLRLKRMWPHEGLAGSTNLYGRRQDARMRSAVYVHNYTQAWTHTRLTSGRTAAAQSRYGVGGRRSLIILMSPAARAGASRCPSTDVVERDGMCRG